MGSRSACQRVGYAAVGEFNEIFTNNTILRRGLSLISSASPKQIIHSELDYRLPITEGLAPFNILQSKGIPSKLVMFPDENHVSNNLYHDK